MLRPIVALSLAVCLAQAAPLGAQDDPVVASRAAYHDAVAAYQARDLPAFLCYATEASRLRPAHGGALYALASAHALLGDTGAALATLRRFAALGYTADVAADSDFATLDTLRAFADLRNALERNATPIARGCPAFTLPERDLLTEGIAYDPNTRAFFVGSVHQRKILRVDRQGRVTRFLSLAVPGLWAPLGMRVDASRRALWVASAAVPQMNGYAPADSLRSGLFRFDLTTGRLTGRFPVPHDGQPHALGDVVVSRDGDAYATDSRGPTIYRVRAGSDSLEAFLDSPLLISAQGLALDPAGERIASVTVLERARPDYAEPTLGVVVGDELFYIANSQWEQFRDDGGIEAPAELRPPLVLRLRL